MQERVGQRHEIREWRRPAVVDDRDSRRARRSARRSGSPYVSIDRRCAAVQAARRPGVRSPRGWARASRSRPGRHRTRVPSAAGSVGAAAATIGGIRAQGSRRGRLDWRGRRDDALTPTLVIHGHRGHSSRHPAGPPPTDDQPDHAQGGSSTTSSPEPEQRRGRGGRVFECERERDVPGRQQALVDQRPPVRDPPSRAERVEPRRRPRPRSKDGRDEAPRPTRTQHEPAASIAPISHSPTGTATPDRDRGR